MKIDADEIDKLLFQYQPEFFLDENGEEHMLITEEGVTMAIPIRSRDFNNFIKDKLMELHKGKAAPSLLEDFRELCGYRARKSGKMQPLPLRVAWKDQSIICNIDDRMGEQVEINAKGWGTVRNKVVFRKGKGCSIPLAKAADINRIFDYINIKNEDLRLLYLVTIASMYVPDISHCILVLHGQAGSAKTTGTWVSEMLVEPKNEDVLGIPKTMRTLEIVVNERHVSAFDNVPVLGNEMSDFFASVRPDIQP